jgi:hypothetical protein
VDDRAGVIFSIVLAVAVLLALGLGLALRGTEAQRLRRRWLRNTPLPRGQAEESLARHVQVQKERFPGRTEAWYLKKILAELERDRR